jgi:hypothetical protein
MIDKSSEAYGEKGYKWRNHLFFTPGKVLKFSLRIFAREQSINLFYWDYFRLKDR